MNVQFIEKREVPDEVVDNSSASVRNLGIQLSADSLTNGDI